MPHGLTPNDSLAGAKTAAGKQKSGLVRAIMKHPLWATIGTIVGVIALVVTYIQSSQSDMPADVELANVSFQDPSPVEAMAGGSDIPETDWEKTTEPATPIDVSLKNNGGAPAHIIRIETKVLDAKTVDCSRQGGGAMVSAYYGVKIPYNPWTMALSSDSISTPVDYTVKAGSIDRMVITVGPEDSGNGKPIVFAVQMRLIQEQGEPIELGPIAISQPDLADNTIRANAMLDLATREPQCMSETSAALNHIYDLTKMQSPDVIRLYDDFKRVT